MKYRVVFSSRAKQDLVDLSDYIAEKSGAERALRYIARIDQWCMRLGSFPERGASREDIRKGLRVAGFERRVCVGFQIAGDAVIIIRVLYGGRDLSRTKFGGALDTEFD